MFEEILTEGAAELGVPLSAPVCAAMRRYCDLLAERNAVMNLTAIRGEDASARLHFLDCLALVPMFPFAGASVIDVGSGAGFPGLPIRLAESTVSLTLLDAQQKRVGFLNEVCASLELDGVRCLHARAEEASRDPALRDSFDFAVSRAVARLNVLCELCLPFVRPGGAFLAMKSAEAEAELDEAAGAIAKLGGRAEAVRGYAIPGEQAVRRVVVIRKLGPTPKAYPRRFARIQASPL